MIFKRYMKNKNVYQKIGVSACLVYIYLFYLNTTTVNVSTNQIQITRFKDYSWKKPVSCKESAGYTEHNVTFVICLFHPENDTFLSSWFHTYAKYDELMMEHFLSATQQYHNSFVIDLGSNLGPYTLGAVALGHDAIAVDPLIEHQALLYNSLLLTQAKGVAHHVLNAVSDSYTVMESQQMDSKNPGRTVMLQSDTANLQSSDQLNTLRIESVLLEDILDLVPVDVPIALKVDVEGYECKALQGFLDSPVKKRFIPYILMELMNICEGGSLCPHYKDKFLPSLQKSGYKAYLPRPVTYDELSGKTSKSGDGNACTPYAFFVHEDARPLPFLDKVKNMEYNH